MPEACSERTMILNSSTARFGAVANRVSGAKKASVLYPQ